MMKIVLICNYYIYNYGSVLQSYALFKFLKQYDKQIVVVNYKDKANSVQKLETLIFWKIRKLFDIHSVIDKLMARKKINSDSAYENIIKSRKKAYDKFVLDNFKFTEMCDSLEAVNNIVSNYDCIVLSSDQLWGPEDLIRGYHTLEFAPNSLKKIAYATSFGVANLTGHFEKIVNRFIPHINSISVREESGKKLIKKICNRDVVTVLDPTMLLTTDEWNDLIGKTQISEITEPYVFCYILGSRIDNISVINRLKNKLRIKFVSVLHPESYNKEEERVADAYIDGVGPTEFLYLIKNAKYVITDSFHASIFSIHFKKQFLVLDRYNNSTSESRNTRIEMLLNTFGLQERHCASSNEMSVLALKREIDWDDVYKKLQEEKEKSVEYLNSALGV